MAYIDSNSNGCLFQPTKRLENNFHKDHIPDLEHRCTKHKPGITANKRSAE